MHHVLRIEKSNWITNIKLTLKLLSLPGTVDTGSTHMIIRSCSKHQEIHNSSSKRKTMETWLIAKKRLRLLSPNTDVRPWTRWSCTTFLSPSFYAIKSVCNRRGCGPSSQFLSALCLPQVIRLLFSTLITIILLSSFKEGDSPLGSSLDAGLKIERLMVQTQPAAPLATPGRGRFIVITKHCLSHIWMSMQCRK